MDPPDAVPNRSSDAHVAYASEFFKCVLDMALVGTGGQELGLRRLAPDPWTVRLGSTLRESELLRVRFNTFKRIEYVQ